MRLKNTRRRKTLKGRLHHNFSTSLHKALKDNKDGRSWELLVGYTLNDLTLWLKRTIPKGYMWQDYLDGKLHVDHKIPQAAFNFNTAEDIDFKRCWALKNLQLLPVQENLIKGDKIDGHFQPSLALKSH